MDDLQEWNSLAWKKAVRETCAAGGNARHMRLRGLAYELAEVFASDLAHAVTTFPEQVMRAWHTDRDDLLVLIDRHAPIAQGTPRWREVEVELATICISELETSLCEVCRNADFVRLDPRMHLRRVCFEAVFGFFFFLLRGSAS